MLKRIIIAVICVLLSMPVIAAKGAAKGAVKIKEGFESKETLTKMELEGEVTVSTEQKHGGKSSLKIPQETVGIYRFGEDNKFGKVTFWVYDSYKRLEEKGSGKDWYGPAFGLINADDNKIVICIRVLSWIASTYLSCSYTAQSGWWTVSWIGLDRVEGWQKFLFDVSDADTIEVTRNDDSKANVYASTSLEYFNQGTNGAYFRGGDVPKEGKKSECFYYDDIVADLK